ncbi:heterokaryon incompatibility protein-domain-containing protein, partial [Scleroderma citrinum]
MTLRNLSKSLRLRFAHQSVTSDLDEAIIFEQIFEREGGHVLPAQVPGGSRGRSATCDSVASTHAHLDPTKIRQVISDVVRHTLFDVPTRLLETGTGLLHDRTGLVHTFENSLQYKELLASSDTCSPTEQIECIRAGVKTYFQYATLSHRWGMEEPLLRDVNIHNIYEITALTEGLIKLQNFCRTAATKGYLWAWSDTCCINKESSAELQEAIGSMFSWYRQSALTIVHLSDVTDTSSAGALSRSVWLKRGWTLQELLAPRAMLFYTQDWSLYMNSLSSNHKEDHGIVDELMRATGISPQYLTSFCPGTDDVRSKLQWASIRHTTIQEDAAYSLFGMFDLQLPVMYGERKEKALGRLLQEIVAQSGDVSVLDWVG